MSVQDEYIQWLAGMVRSVADEASRELLAGKKPGRNYLGGDIDAGTLRRVKRAVRGDDAPGKSDEPDAGLLEELAFWRWVAFEGYGGKDPRTFPWTQQLFMVSSFMRTGWSIDELAGGSIVELGCGPLGMVEFLPGATKAGFDPLNAYYENLFGKARRGDVHYTSDLDELLADRQGTFDLGICFNVLDHLPEPRPLLDALMSLIRPDGRFLVQVNTIRDECTQPNAHRRMHPSPFTAERIISWLAEYSDDCSTHVAEEPSEYNEFFFLAWGTKSKQPPSSA